MTNKNKIPFSKYIYDWVVTYLPKQRIESPQTLRNYKLSIKLFLDYLEEKGINCIDEEAFSPNVINNWIVWMTDIRGNQPTTCNARLAALKSFTKYLGVRDATLRGIYTDLSNCVRAVKAPKRKVHGMSTDIISALFAVPDANTKIGVRDLTFMVLLYGAALRIDEILSIKICHLHLDANDPYVNIVGKGNKIRSPFLMGGIVKQLRIYISAFHGDNPRPEDFLFYSPVRGLKGKPSQQCFRNRLEKIAKIANERNPSIPTHVWPHRFRHAKAQHMLDEGFNLAEVSEYLGHANLNTTMVYTDIDLKKKANALREIEKEMPTPQAKKWKGKEGDIDELRKVLGI
jgi:site-specific recombinase XerC